MQGITKTYLLVCEGQCNLAYRENQANKFYVGRKEKPNVTTHTFSHATSPAEDSEAKTNYVKLIFQCNGCGCKRVFGTMLSAS